MPGVVEFLSMTTGIKLSFPVPDIPLFNDLRLSLFFGESLVTLPNLSCLAIIPDMEKTITDIIHCKKCGHHFGVITNEQGIS